MYYTRFQSSTMLTGPEVLQWFIFILEPSVFIPKGGYSRTFQLEGILLPCLYFKFLTTSAAPVLPRLGGAWCVNAWCVKAFARGPPPPPPPGHCHDILDLPGFIVYPGGAASHRSPSWQRGSLGQGGHSPGEQQHPFIPRFCVTQCRPLGEAGPPQGRHACHSRQLTALCGDPLQLQQHSARQSQPPAPERQARGPTRPREGAALDSPFPHHERERGQSFWGGHCGGQRVARALLLKRHSLFVPSVSYALSLSLSVCLSSSSLYLFLSLCLFVFLSLARSLSLSPSRSLSFPLPRLLGAEVSAGSSIPHCVEASAGGGHRAPLRLGTVMTSSTFRGLLFTHAGPLPGRLRHDSGAPWVLPFPAVSSQPCHCLLWRSLLTAALAPLLSRKRAALFHIFSTTLSRRPGESSLSRAKKTGH